MEDTSLSLLLEDLMQQNQIQWVESLDTENNLYITNNNENTTLDLFSVLQDGSSEDGFNGSCEELSTLPISTENVNTQSNKKRFVTLNVAFLIECSKRREMQKESEANRRMKFKEQLTMLRTLLYGIYFLIIYTN